MKIAIIDCDHDSFGPERDLAQRLDVHLDITPVSGPDEFVRRAQGADGILMQYAPVTGEVLDKIPGVRAIGRYGVGYETIDVAEATARGVAVCNVTDYGSESVSDHALTLALALARGIPPLDRGIRRGSHGLEPVRPLHEFRMLTFGVIGTGAIGRLTARKASALGFRVVGHDVDPAATTAAGVDAVSFETLITESDIVSLHVPLTPKTRKMIDAAALALMRPGAILVNTSRGGVVDTKALVDALSAGKLAGAGLDVLDEEPVSAAHPLTAFDRVVLTPHAAWYSEESYVRLKERTLRNVIDVLAGRLPHDILNPEVITMNRAGAEA